MRNITPLSLIDYNTLPKPAEGPAKIDRAGVYSNLPIDLYHGDICVGPSVSSGVLRLCESKSMAHVWANSYLNPKREPPKVKEAWVFGRAAHTLLLGEAGFREGFVVRPETYPDGQAKAWSGNSKECKAWLAEQALARKDVLLPQWIDDIRGMATKLGAHPVIQSGILNGLVEKSIIWPVEVPTSRGPVTIWLKARPDAMPISSNMAADYKTTDDAAPVAVRRAISDHGYEQQLALADWGMFVTTGRKITDHVLVFQEKKAPYSINHKPIEPSAIEWGHRQNWRALCRFAECYATGVWPDYDDDEVPAGLTDYKLNRLVYEDKMGLLPTFDPYAVQEDEAF